jgi:cold shock CspA family protein
MPHSDRHKGTVVQWRENGYGWIREDDTALRVYVHASKLRDRQTYADLPVGTRVEFDLEPESRGLAAGDVVVLSLAGVEGRAERQQREAS